MPYGCYAVCHTPCSSCSLRSWQLLVSFMPLHSFRPPLLFITPRSQLNSLLQGMAHLPNAQGYTQCSHTFAQGQPYKTHRVPFATLRTAFISVAFSPPAAYYSACLAARFQKLPTAKYLIFCFINCS